MILFYLKKVIGMLLMPIPFSLLLTLTGVWLLQRRPALGKGLILLSALWLGLTSWHPVANRLLAPYEHDYARFDTDQPVSTVVVLGGCHASDASVPPAAQLCSSSLFRLTEGLRILAANPQARLFVSGYAGSDQRPHAEVMKEVAVSMGINPERISTFPTARDTAEEAALMAPLLANEPFALVSEASHLPRAVRFFQHEGLTPLPAPAVRFSNDQPEWRMEASAAYKSERALYETLGRLWQMLRS
ncbi:envelope biogenesis factor ElyC [Thalassolituus sp. LLYu03]|uniref:envelope biogenesis factor ElyC n=1 Tax=Thalassolituus sp. LLYu03 TaxID=3421656 RepID=UPI003D2E8CDC